MAWAKPFKGKKQRKPGKTRKQYKIKKLKKWENSGKTKAKPA